VTEPEDLLSIRLFEHEGVVYAQCAEIDQAAWGATDAEALADLSKAILTYYVARGLGLQTRSRLPDSVPTDSSASDRLFETRPPTVEQIEAMTEMRAALEALQNDETQNKLPV
jgi:hypothetical protein